MDLRPSSLRRGASARGSSARAWNAVVPAGARVQGRAGTRGSGAGGLSLQDDQGDDIADALDRLHAGVWSIGDTTFCDVVRDGQVWVVTGIIDENMIRAEGAARQSAAPSRLAGAQTSRLRTCEAVASRTRLIPSPGSRSGSRTTATGVLDLADATVRLVVDLGA